MKNKTLKTLWFLPALAILLTQICFNGCCTCKDRRFWNWNEFYDFHEYEYTELKLKLTKSYQHFLLLRRLWKPNIYLIGAFNNPGLMVHPLKTTFWKGGGQWMVLLAIASTENKDFGSVGAKSMKLRYSSLH